MKIQLISVAAAGDYATVLTENRLADGTLMVSAGVVHYGADGKIDKLRNLSEAR